jgi:hypothetical protein
MSRGVAKSTLILMALFCASQVGPATAQASGNKVGFVNSGQTATLNCAGGKAEIVGSNNVLTVTGNCANLELAGSDNKITIQLAAAAKISFVGSNNAIAWTSADGKPPTVSYMGAGNSMTPSVQ